MDDKPMFFNGDKVIVNLPTGDLPNISGTICGRSFVDIVDIWLVKIDSKIGEYDVYSFPVSMIHKL